MPGPRGRHGGRGGARVWTPEREARLLELAAERGGFDRAAAEFGLAVGTCRVKASLLRRAAREAEARRAAEAAGRCPEPAPAKRPVAAA